ncbi:MAG: ABC transporter ATP-binding protein [Phycisphaeraceae bacterium]|nr:ABC transporter ATP-binding protein [Phycisphaeraceae bacterium]
MIVAHHVTKRFRRAVAVDDASFELEAGRALALWGSNGAGKTTLIRCILGVFRFHGSISIAGVDVRRRGRAARALVGYVPQELSFHDDTRLGSAIAFFAQLRGVSVDRAVEALGAVNLQGHQRKRVRDLSGGMKQRLALAVALVSDPPVIVLDEPTSNLDASGRDDVMEALRGLKSRGKTIVFASHRPEEVASLADRVLVMEKGRIAADRGPRDMWGEHGHTRRIRLRVSSDSLDVAYATLRHAGVDAHLNGNGLCVTTSSDRKATPIQVLARASIEVRDFEFLDDHDAKEAGS